VANFFEDKSSGIRTGGAKLARLQKLRFSACGQVTILASPALKKIQQNFTEGESLPAGRQVTSSAIIEPCLMRPPKDLSLPANVQIY